MNLLNVRYDNITCEQALDKILSMLKGAGKSTLCFLNADCVFKAQKDLEYRAIVNSADLVLSDGIGLKIASKVFGEAMVDNCNGTDLSPRIIQPDT